MKVNEARKKSTARASIISFSIATFQPVWIRTGAHNNLTSTRSFTSSLFPFKPIFNLHLVSIPPFIDICVLISLSLSLSLYHSLFRSFFSLFVSISLCEPIINSHFCHAPNRYSNSNSCLLQLSCFANDNENAIEIKSGVIRYYVWYRIMKWWCSEYEDDGNYEAINLLWLISSSRSQIDVPSFRAQVKLETRNEVYNESIFKQIWFRSKSFRNNDNHRSPVLIIASATLQIDVPL